jgi:hypothetical protein
MAVAKEYCGCSEWECVDALSAVVRCVVDTAWESAASVYTSQVCRAGAVHSVLATLRGMQAALAPLSVLALQAAMQRSLLLTRLE